MVERFENINKFLRVAWSIILHFAGNIIVAISLYFSRKIV